MPGTSVAVTVLFCDRQDMKTNSIQISKLALCKGSDRRVRMHNISLKKLNPTREIQS